MLNVVMSNVILLGAIILSVIMSNVTFLKAVMTNIVMPNVSSLSTVMLNVGRLKVGAPLSENLDLRKSFCFNR